MPVTPFHFGPGLALKAVFGARFSLGVFCATNVIIDLETGYNLLSGNYPVHTFFHGFLGTNVAATLAVFTLPICRVIATHLQRDEPGLFRGLTGDTNVGWTAAVIAAWLGAYSHVLFDAIMHSDARPFAPWSSVNPLLDVIPLLWLHGGCVLFGVVGVVVLRARAKPNN